METAQRAAARVKAKAYRGSYEQVDGRCMVIGPARPELTDPFLAPSEDWFSTPGFEWYPHCGGLGTVTQVLDGVLEHGDNAIIAGALTAGWVNLPENRKQTHFDEQFSPVFGKYENEHRLGCLKLQHKDNS